MRDSQIKWYLQKSLPVSGGGGVVVEEGEHVELERVVLLPGQAMEIMMLIIMMIRTNIFT